MDRLAPVALARAGQAEPGSAACRLLDVLPHPVLALTEDATLLFANDAARPWLHAGSCLRLRFGRVFEFAGPASEKFADALARALRGTLVNVTFAPTDGAAPGLWRARLWAVPEFLQSDRDLGNAAVILALDPPPRLETGIVAIARLFGLTAAEARVLAFLARDHTPNEIAVELQVAPATVRSHLQALFQKTGARRQPELVKLAFQAACS
jgi:DNA-binding CsgD family transcriptional regulator